MNLRSRVPLISLSLLLLAALACNASGPTSATASAQTVEAVLTASAAPGNGTPVAGDPSSTPPSPTVTFVPSATFIAPVEKPSDTPGPTNTPGAQGCSDNAQFVADVTIPDNTAFNPGAPFTKTWRLRNTGSCTWVGSYTLAFVSGAALNGPALVAVTGNVAPGAEYNVSVNLLAPAAPGVYKGVWQMRNSANAYFGSQPFVQIVVPAASATPTLTASPAPISPTPTQTATATQPVVLTWPLVKVGDTGANVYAVQYLLRQHGDALTADGAFGPQTETAVKNFQSANSLTTDGIVGPLTWAKLIVTVQQGSNNEAVRAVQRLLNDKYGFALAVDGNFGLQTDAAVKAFQGGHGLTMDGIVGPNTWSALVS